MPISYLRRLILPAVLLPALLLAACTVGDEEPDAGSESKGRITVGVSGAFAENQIVAEMYAQVLEDAGYEVDRQLEIGARDISQAALESGEIDIVPEYLASLLLFLDPDAAASSDAGENAEAIETIFEEMDFYLLEPSAANDTNALVVTAETAQDLGLGSISDLAPVASDLILGGPPECPERPFCLPGLRDTYGIEFAEFKPLDVGGPLTVAALEGGQIDVALLFSTSSVIAARDFVLLTDDKGLQAAENITPVVRWEVRSEEVEDLLNAVSATLDTARMTALNARVEIDNEDPSDVARDHLESEGLV